MQRKEVKRMPRISFVLLVAIGISNIGDWIYLIAYNLIILNMTGSPIAVAILYILKPVAAILTNGWSGSLIDRMNKKKLMIWLDVSRGLLLFILPMVSSLSVIYFIVLLINMGSAIFHPASLTYMTKLIPEQNRYRFNALRSLVDSGAFLVGPALAGILFMVGSPIIAVFLNGVTFIVSGFLTLLIPDVENRQEMQHGKKLSGFVMVKTDWKTVSTFSRQNQYVLRIYMLFSCITVLTAAIDSLEAVFARQELALTDFWYGLLVSVAGAGIIFGAILNTLFSHLLKPLGLIGIASVFLAAGYLVYAFSESFSIAGIGFFILSFSLAFAGTGFTTFIQTEVPIDMLGRLSSIYGWVESILVILCTGLFGLLAHFFSVRMTVVAGSGMLLIISLVLFIQCIKTSAVGVESVKQV
ncbi:MFS transporter [Virgibacillus senegalensis]|uniref:MFS transporter n=1 Tax=Virgibacillus senegalensis TaxID=1499679 RepID=UPI00389AAB33